MNREIAPQRKREMFTLSFLAILLLTIVALPSSALSQVPQSPMARRLVEALRESLAVDSLNAQLHYELANALHDAGEKEEAFLHYDKAVSLKPGFLEALVNRGAVLNELGRIEEAMASFESALSIEPRDPKALLNLGNSLYALQRYGEAIKRYKLAIESDTTFVEAYYYMGIAFADAGIYREAIREWQKILEIAPGSDVSRNARDNIEVLRKFLSAK